MKGIISGIKRMEIHDGDGLRTTVFFKGCPLKCVWCHNPESISFKKQVAFFKDKCIGCGICGNLRTEQSAKTCPVQAQVLYGTEYTPQDLFSELIKDELFFKNGNGGVTFSGGECLAQIDFAYETAKLLYERGISLYIDTCGFVSRGAFERIIPFTDKFLYDIKAIDADVHRKCTGQGNEVILQNLKFLSDSNCKIEIRYPLVCGRNDGECDKIGAFLKGMKGITQVKVLRYHRFAASRYDALNMPNTLPCAQTTQDDVNKAVEILKSYDLDAVC